MFIVSWVTCKVSCFMCNMLCVTCHLSVTPHDMCPEIQKSCNHARDCTKYLRISANFQIIYAKQEKLAGILCICPNLIKFCLYHIFLCYFLPMFLRKYYKHSKLIVQENWLLESLHVTFVMDHMSPVTNATTT